MAVTMDAILKLRAMVQGTGAVDALTGGIKRLSATAQGASGGFRQLAGSMGGVVGGLQMLTPLATGAGLLGLASNSIKAAEGMYDLAQRTGVSVEALSRFRRPAAMAGTDIESVAKALQKLSKGLVEGKGSAVDGLTQLGINSVDASGKMKSVDQIMLEVADRFAVMPDGIEKTGLAMQIFGRAGAEMIPMLNEGGAALSKFKGITTEYAQQADEAGDSMVMLQGKIGAIGGQVAKVLLPFMIQATEVLTDLVDGFTKLPGPLQTIIGGIAALAIAFVPLSGVIATLLPLFAALSGLSLGATIAGWAGAIGPAIAAIGTVLTGFLGFLTSTILPGLLAFFSGPVGWTVLAVAAVVAMAVAFREPIMGFLTWLYEWSEPFRQFWVDLWNKTVESARMAMTWLAGVIQQAAEGLIALMYEFFVQPWVELWEKVIREPVTAGVTWLGEQWKALSTAFVERVVAPVQLAWTGVMEFLPKAMTAARDKVVSIWTGVINTIKAVVNSVMATIANGINFAIKQINNVIAGINKIPGVPDIPRLANVQIPKFADGGYVTRRTLAEIGEGGEPEYVVPARKALSFANNIRAGRTGEAALAMTTSGSQMMAPQAAASGRSLPPVQLRQNLQVNATGQVGGEPAVTVAEVQRLVGNASQDVINQMALLLQQPSFQRQVGLRG